MALLSTVTACGQEPPLLNISDRIGDEAFELRQSERAEGAVTFRFDNDGSWVLIFIGKDGLGPDAENEVRLDEKSWREVAELSQSWRGSPHMIHVAPRSWSSTRLPDDVDVQQLAVVRGEGGRSDIRVTLARHGDSVVVTSVASTTVE
jgi:hypothetical protein